MKILNVNYTVDKETGGGTAERTLKMSEALQQAGCQCRILTLNLSDGPKLKKYKGVSLVYLPYMFRRFYIPTFSIKTLKKIKTEVKNADVIHIMSHWSILNVLVYMFCKIFKKLYVVCPAGSMIIYGRSIIVKKIFNFIFLKRIIRNASCAIAITIDEIDQFAKYGLAKEKIIHIPNGIKESDFKYDDTVKFRNKYNIGSAPFILFIGRLNKIKGPDILVEAFIKAKELMGDYLLVIAGPDEGMQEELNKSIKNAELDSKIKLIGFLNQKDKSSAYNESSFVVIPSRFEAMSIVVLEAGILKKPVIITDRCGFSEVKEYNGGIICTPDVDSLSESLCEMIQRSELDRMGKNLYTLIKAKYTWDIIGTKFVKLYEKII